MAGVLAQTYAAGRLVILTSGAVDLADPVVLAKAVEILADFTPDERVQIGERAVALGADPTVVIPLINLATGEVIEVTSSAPKRRWPWLWIILASAAVAGTGGVLIHRARRRRRALRAGG